MGGDRFGWVGYGELVVAGLSAVVGLSVFVFVYHLFIYLFICMFLGCKWPGRGQVADEDMLRAHP